ncbi:MAG: hypothetical protein U0271_37060 [Polyangiaceae bacterium]
MRRSSTSTPLLRWCAAALLAAAASASGIAAAQEKSAAELQKEGRAALGRGEIDAACTLFESAYSLTMNQPADAMPKPMEVLFDMADCHEKQGQARLAATEFDQVAGAGGPNADFARMRAAKLRGEGPPKTEPPKTEPPKTEPPKTEPPPTVVKTQSDEAPTRIGDFMDTRLSWVIGDDDVLKQTGQAYPLSPDVSVGDRKQYRLFFDNLNSRFSGRENLTHLALYKKMPGFIDGLDTEASLILRLDIAALASNSGNVNQAFYDAGSYIRAFYHTAKYDDPKKVEGIGFTLWPIDTDRFRLGYLYDLSWGGTNPYINQSIFPRIVGSSPGARISYEHPRFSVYVGFKTAQIVQVQETLTPGTSEVEQIRVGQTNYGVLGGVSAQPHDNFHFDLGGGFFTQGKFDLPDVEGLQVWTAGAAARLVVHHEKYGAGQSIDFSLYRNDPNKPQIIFKPETYEAGKAFWQVSLEGDALFQRLKDFDVTGQVTVQPAFAAALQGILKYDYFRASITGIFRDLPYVLRNQPSFIPFETLPADAKTDPEFFFALSADYYIKDAHLTPGIGLGLQFPSTFTSESVDLSSAPISRTVVVRDQGNIAILPVNTGATPIFQARASVRWDISSILSTMLWVQYIRDNNATFVERDPAEGSVALRTFVSPDFFGLGLGASARF